MWQIGAGSNATGNAVATAPDGSLVLGGEFSAIGGSPANHVARRVGATWSPLGSGVAFNVHALAVANDGTIYAGGWNSGSQILAHVQRWDGTAWTTLWQGTACYPEGCWAWVKALAFASNGDLFVGGGWQQFAGVSSAGLVRWNGVNWSVVAPTFLFDVSALLRTNNGDMLVGGYVGPIGGGSPHLVARWDGTMLTPFAAGAPAAMVLALGQSPNGDVIAGGTFQTIGGIAANRIARWNGTTWSPLGAGMDDAVRSITVLPNGDVIAGGSFTNAGGIAANRIARWNGTSWSPVGSGVNAHVMAMALLPAGELIATGFFSTAGGHPAGQVASVVPTCPANASAYAAGCAGSAGQVSLAAVQWPWLGADFVARASGVPASSIVVNVVGFASASGPLSSLLPLANPGCSLSVSPAFLGTSLPANGAAVLTLAVPNAMALVGQTFFDQAVVFDLSGGAVHAITSSNALQLTIGAL